jgi:hypothetical protein
MSAFEDGIQAGFEVMPGMTAPIQGSLPVPRRTGSVKQPAAPEEGSILDLLQAEVPVQFVLVVAVIEIDWNLGGSFLADRVPAGDLLPSLERSKVGFNVR